jgi:hypothetical protein
MLLAAETLKVLCAATQEFANMTITSTEHVEDAIKRHVKPMMRDVNYPDGSVFKAEFWTLKPSQTDDYRNNQQTLVQWLKRFENLPIRSQHPRDWTWKSAPLREAMQSTLQRLVYATTTEFSADGHLVQRPVRFGVECAFYFALAGMLEPDADCRVRRCQCGHGLDLDVPRCRNFIVHAGGRGQPPEFCCRAHAQKHRNLRRRTS